MLVYVHLPVSRQSLDEEQHLQHAQGRSWGSGTSTPPLPTDRHHMSLVHGYEIDKTCMEERSKQSPDLLIEVLPLALVSQPALRREREMMEGSSSSW